MGYVVTLMYDRSTVLVMLKKGQCSIMNIQEVLMLFLFMLMYSSSLSPPVCPASPMLVSSEFGAVIVVELVTCCGGSSSSCDPRKIQLDASFCCKFGCSRAGGTIATVAAGG